MSKARLECGECGRETRAKARMGNTGEPWCGPCRRAGERRERITDTTCCGEQAAMVDDGLYRCEGDCGRTFEGPSL